jgi:hypothetical protein
MPLTPEELDALLKFLDHQWMPELVQRAYDKLDLDRQTQQSAETRLSDLEQRLRNAAEQVRLSPPAPTPEDIETDGSLPHAED